MAHWWAQSTTVFAISQPPPARHGGGGGAWSLVPARSSSLGQEGQPVLTVLQRLAGAVGGELCGGIHGAGRPAQGPNQASACTHGMCLAELICGNFHRGLLKTTHGSCSPPRGLMGDETACVVWHRGCGKGGLCDWTLHPRTGGAEGGCTVGTICHTVWKMFAGVESELESGGFVPFPSALTGTGVSLPQCSPAGLPQTGGLPNRVAHATDSSAS